MNNANKGIVVRGVQVVTLALMDTMGILNVDFGRVCIVASAMNQMIVECLNNDEILVELHLRLTIFIFRCYFAITLR